MTVRGHLFNLFVTQESAKESAKDIWCILEPHYGGDDSGRKKYNVGKWLQFQMTDDKPVVEQINKYENLVANVLSEGMKMCEILQANVLMEKFPPSCSDYQNHLKHKKKDLKLQDLISHIRTEEANKLKDKLASKNVNSVNANLVESSSVNRDKPKHDKRQNGRTSEKVQFKAHVGKIKKDKFISNVCEKEEHKSYHAIKGRGDQTTKNQHLKPTLLNKMMKS